MSWKTIFNPFEKFSEYNLLMVGVISLLTGSFCGNYFSVTFDGIFDAHTKQITFLHSLKENVINILIVFTVLYILGKILYKKTRAIDILVISMIYRIPIYAISFIINNPFLEKVNEKIVKEIQHPENLTFAFSEMAVLIIFSVLMLLIVIYAITLLTNGFRNATNLRKWQNYIWFAIALITGEILSKTFINLI